MIDHTKKMIRMEALWGLSNIMAAHFNQIQAVMETNIIRKLIDSLEYEDVGVSFNPSIGFDNDPLLVLDVVSERDFDVLEKCNVERHSASNSSLCHGI